MNNTAFTEAYIQEKKGNRSRASRSVLRHFRMRKLQRKIAFGILGSTVLLVIFGMLLFILPAFKVETIHIYGNDILDEKQLIEASGVSIGDEILNLDKDAIAARIAQTEGVESVLVSTSLSEVSIRVIQK